MRMKLHLASVALILMGASATRAPDALPPDWHRVSNEIVVDTSEFAHWKCGTTPVLPGDTYESIALRVMGSTTHAAALAALNFSGTFSRSFDESWRDALKRPVDQTEIATLPAAIVSARSSSRATQQSQPDGRFVLLARLPDRRSGTWFKPVTAIDFTSYVPGYSIQLIAIPEARIEEAIDFLSDERNCRGMNNGLPEWILRTDSPDFSDVTSNTDRTRRILTRFRLRADQGNMLNLIQMSEERFDREDRLVTWNDMEEDRSFKIPPNAHVLLFSAAGLGALLLLGTWYVRSRRSLS